jgi:hypothetical protein
MRDSSMLHLFFLPLEGGGQGGGGVSGGTARGAKSTPPLTPPPQGEGESA